MAKRTKKLSRPQLKLEALEQRQLLAGISGAGTEVGKDIHHTNGNVYDQVLMTGSSVSVTADTGQVTRVSFLDAQGDIVQAEFSGAGQLTVSLADGYKTDVAPDKYLQTGVKYVQGLASFTISGSDASTNFTVFSVGKVTGTNGALFDDTHTGGDHLANIARLTIVADPSNPNGSLFGGIKAGNALFSADSGVVGITAANVQVQNLVRVQDIDATGTATPALVFGTNSQFVSVDVQGGDLVQTNGKAINNSGSYGYSVGSVANVDAAGNALPAKTITAPFTDKSPYPAPKTYDLTTAIDNIVGTANNDTINASHTSGSLVVSALDTVNGGDGIDTLSISDAAGSAPISGLTVTNVENFAYTSTGRLGASDTLNTTGWTGLTSTTLVLQNIGTNAQTYTAAKGTDVNITSNATGLATTETSGTWGITGGKTVTLTNTAAGAAGAADISTGNVTVTGVDGTTAVTVTQSGKKGAGTYGKVDVTDFAASDKTSTISSVTVKNVGTASTITSQALTNLSLTNVTANYTITDNKAAHADAAGRTTLALAVNESTTGIVDTNSTIKEIDITTSGKASTVDVDAGNKNVLTTVTVAGDKDLTLSTTGTDGDKFATLTATGTGGVTATVGANVTVSTSSGKDAITLTAATKKAISLGGGDDWIAAPLSSGKLGTGGSLDGGDGTDTLSLTFADAKAASAATTFQGTVTGFEKIELTGAAGADADQVNLHNLDDISQVVVASNLTKDVSLKGLASGASVTFTVGQTAGKTVTIDIPTSAVSNETLALKVSGSAALDVKKIDTGLITAVALNSDDTASSPGGGFTHVAEFTSSSLKTITLTGDAGAEITNTSTGVTTIDGSGLTKGVLKVDSVGALGSAATITGSSQGDTIVATNATKAVTVHAGAGANSVTIANAQNNSIDSGDGNDTVSVGSGDNTITTGSGNDQVSLNTAGNVGANTVDVGDGNDKVTVGKATGQTTITLGGGDDTVAFAAGSAPATTGYFVTVAGAGDADVIDFSALKNGDTSLTALSKVTLGQGVSFTDYLNTAAANTAGATNSVVSWFQFGGDTYVVIDNSNSAVFDDNVDMVVKLSGSIDLSAGGTTATISAGGILTL